MLFWHLGATIAFIRYAFRDPGMDLRFLAAGAIAADVIDLPVGIALWSTYQTPRLAAHSLLVPAVAMVVVLVATGRGGRRKQWMLFTVGMLVHLALDGMWRQPETLWWPFLGWEFTATEFSGAVDYIGSVLRDPWVWVGEAVGLLYLVILWRRSGLTDPQHRAALVKTGVVSARIE